MTKIDEVVSGSAQLLDVRTPEEWDEGHAEHAVHISIDDLLQGKTEPLDPTKKIYVYCQAGGRAGRATAYLQQQGFEAENVGGLSTWLHDASSQV
jgi:rhodanese-related sulfurtransferase